MLVPESGGINAPSHETNNTKSAGSPEVALQDIRIVWAGAVRVIGGGVLRERASDTGQQRKRALDVFCDPWLSDRP